MLKYHGQLNAVETKGKMMSLKMRVKKCTKSFSFEFAMFVFAFALMFFVSPVHATLYMSISGRAVDKDTGTPIPDLRIIAVPKAEKLSADFIGISDKEGKFLIDMVPAGDYLLVIGNETIYQNELPLREVTVIDGKNLTNVNIELKKGASVSGVVYESDGVTPAPSIPMLIFSQTEGKAGKTISGKNGAFSIKGLPPSDNYTLLAFRMGSAATIIRNVSVTSGTDVSKNIVFGRPDTEIKGKISDGQGNVITNGAFVGFVSDSGEIGIANSDSMGNYSIKGLPNGNYKVNVISFGYKLLQVEAGLIDFKQSPIIKDFSLIRDTNNNPLDPIGLPDAVGVSLTVSGGFGIGGTYGIDSVQINGTDYEYSIKGVCGAYGLNTCLLVEFAWYSGTRPPPPVSWCGEFVDLTVCFPTPVPFLSMCGGGFRSQDGNWTGVTGGLCFGTSFFYDKLPVIRTPCLKCYKLLPVPPVTLESCGPCDCPSFTGVLDFINR